MKSIFLEMIDFIFFLIWWFYITFRSGNGSGNGCPTPSSGSMFKSIAMTHDDEVDGRLEWMSFIWLIWNAYIVGIFL